MNTNNNTGKMGATMLGFAWVIGFILVAVVFQEWLNQQQNPNSAPKGQRNSTGDIEVVLEPNRQHHYVVSGHINQQEVVFLLDTGATTVVVPEDLAERLSLNKGHSLHLSTANGYVEGYHTNIDQLNIDQITLHEVSATINPGMTGDVVLLGMSALRKIEFAQKGDLFILRQ